LPAPLGGNERGPVGSRSFDSEQPDGSIEARNRSGIRRDWFRQGPFRAGLRALAAASSSRWS
jgi:hypothetical protein